MHYKRTYILFLSIILLMTASSQYLIHQSIEEQGKDSRLINLAGRQRMLSQNIAKQVLLIQQEQDSEHLIQHQEKLLKLVQTWKNVHHGLINGDDKLGLPGNNSPYIQSLFEKLQPDFNAIVHNINLSVSLTNSLKIRKDALQQIMSLEKSFLENMDRIVFAYDKEAKQKVSQLKQLEMGISLLMLFVIFLEVMLIIRPVLTKIKNQNTDLHKINAELIEKNEHIATQNKNYLAINKALSEAKNKAEVAAVTKAQFLSNMSHEIRTPMNAVIGITNLLLDGNPKPDQLELLNTLQFSSENLLTIINDILDFSKIESGKIKFEQVDVHIRNLIRNIQNTQLLNAQNKGLDLEVSIDSNVPEMIVGDPVRLSQVIINLTNNAIKFTEKGKVQVRIAVKSKEGEKVNLFFEVIDTGIGIAKSKHDLIFKSFAQADTNTTRIYGGTGLGLAITKKLIELQGGTIGVDSDIGKGARFFFEITYGISDNLKRPGKDTARLIQTYSLVDPKRVLIVEDNKINQLVATRFLNKWNVKYDIANNGYEAISAVQQNDYGLVLMDLQMPEMDGYEATRIIRHMNEGQFKRLPIVALSASAMMEIRDQAMEAGMNDFVAKPFKPKELFKTLSKYISA